MQSVNLGFDVQPRPKYVQPFHPEVGRKKCPSLLAQSNVANVSALFGKILYLVFEGGDASLRDGMRQGTAPNLPIFIFGWTG